MLKSKKLVNILLAAILMVLPLALAISSNVSADEYVPTAYGTTTAGEYFPLAGGTVKADTILNYPFEEVHPNYYNFNYRESTSTFNYPVNVNYMYTDRNTLAAAHSDFWNTVKHVIHTARPGEVWTIDAANFASGGKKTLTGKSANEPVINVYPIIYNNIPYGVFEWLYYAKGKTLYVHYSNITLKYTPKDVKTPEIPGIIRYLDVYEGEYVNKYLSATLIKK